MSDSIHELVSRNAVSATSPEPAEDLQAQIDALRDPSHPKAAVFVAAGNENEMPALPRDVYVARRREGTLLTVDPGLATLYSQMPHITDADVARLLGYPETKADVMAKGNAVVVQARDAQDRVVTEACATVPNIKVTCDALRTHVPKGGQLVILSVLEALQRRARKLH